MILDLASRRDLTLETYRRVAWEGAQVRLAPAARQRIDSARSAFLRLLDEDPEVVIYGVTTGYGQHADKRLDPEQRRRHAQRPPLAPAVSFGAPLPTRVVRGIVLARLANFVEGHAAVSPELADRVVQLLDGRDLPEVPAEGNGMAGEITPLSHLFAPVARAHDLGEKEALALISGAPVAAAFAGDAALGAAGRLRVATEVFALSSEAIAAPLEQFDPALAGLWGDRDQAHALERFGALLEGGARERRPYQAPVSWRILPRVLGQARRAGRQAEEVAAGALAAVTDNPVFLMPDAAHPLGRVLSNGGYHEARTAPALDALTSAQADLALLADRQVSKLLDGRVSLLPHQLPAGEGYLGTLGFAAAGFAAEARDAAGATLLAGSEGGGFGQNDVAVPHFRAWQRYRRSAQALDSALAVLAVVASQALYVTDRAAPPALAGLLADVRAQVPVVGAQRALGPELGPLAAALRQRAEPD